MGVSPIFVSFDLGFEIEVGNLFKTIHCVKHFMAPMCGRNLEKKMVDMLCVFSPGSMQKDFQFGSALFLASYFQTRYTQMGRFL